MSIIKKKLTPISYCSIQAGFPSPADDFLESELNLHDYLIHNKNSTFMVKVNGDSMVGAGILSGDILVVDRARQYKDNNIVIAILDGDLTVKRLIRDCNKKWILQAETDNPYIIPITGNTLEIWGVVTGVVRNL